MEADLVLLEQTGMFINSLITILVSKERNVSFFSVFCILLRKLFLWNTMNNYGKRCCLILFTFYVSFTILAVAFKPEFALNILWKQSRLTYWCVDPSDPRFVCFQWSVLIQQWPYYPAKFKLPLVRLAICLLWKSCQKRWPEHLCQTSRRNANTAFNSQQKKNSTKHDLCHLYIN